MRLSLSKRTLYGLRIMRALSRMHEGQRMTADQLSRVSEVPRGFVPAIVATMHRAGLIACSPGRTGGCILKQRPEHISLLDIVSALEGDLSSSHCVLDGRECMDGEECDLHPFWEPVKRAMVDSLGSVSLAELDAYAPLIDTTDTGEREAR